MFDAMEPLPNGILAHNRFLKGDSTHMKDSIFFFFFLFHITVKNVCFFVHKV